MKMALVTDASEPWAACCTSSTEWPFFTAISAATMAHSTSATWIGPSSASSPNRAIDPPISTANVTSGRIASSSDGSRAGADGPVVGALSLSSGPGPVVIAPVLPRWRSRPGVPTGGRALLTPTG
jgi:hypothetical protein